MIFITPTVGEVPENRIVTVLLVIFVLIPAVSAMIFMLTDIILTDLFGIDIKEKIMDFTDRRGRRS